MRGPEVGLRPRGPPPGHSCTLHAHCALCIAQFTILMKILSLLKVGGFHYLQNTHMLRPLQLEIADFYVTDFTIKMVISIPIVTVTSISDTGPERYLL